VRGAKHDQTGVERGSFAGRRTCGAPQGAGIVPPMKMLMMEGVFSMEMEMELELEMEMEMARVYV
jgi:hypothetical protein